MPWIDPVDDFAALPRVSDGPIKPEVWDGTFETIYGLERVESVTIDGTTIDAGGHGTVELLDAALSGVTLETGGSSAFDTVDSILTGCNLSRAHIDTIRGAHLVAVGDLRGCLMSDVQTHQLAVHLALAAGASLERDE